MTEDKRKPRAYKVTDKAYKKAMSRAEKEKTHLANLIEDVVVAYGAGYDIVISGENKKSKKK